MSSAPWATASQQGAPSATSQQQSAAAAAYNPYYGYYGYPSYYGQQQQQQTAQAQQPPSAASSAAPAYAAQGSQPVAPPAAAPQPGQAQPAAAAGMPPGVVQAPPGATQPQQQAGGAAQAPPGQLAPSSAAIQQAYWQNASAAQQYGAWGYYGQYYPYGGAYPWGSYPYYNTAGATARPAAQAPTMPASEMTLAQKIAQKNQMQRQQQQYMLQSYDRIAAAKYASPTQTAAAPPPVQPPVDSRASGAGQQPAAPPPPPPAYPAPQPPAVTPPQEDRQAAAVAPAAWPPQLKAYVQRVFDACEGREDREHAEKHLKNVIMHAATAGGIDKMDWDNEPLPLFLSVVAVEVPLPIPLAVERELEEPQQVEEQRAALEKKRKKDKGKKKQQQQFVEDPRKKGNRRARFAIMDEPYDPVAAMSSLPSETPVPDSDDLEQPVVGTCTDLEKRYFRLTSKPDPATVRPESVLHQSLRHARDKWEQNRDYVWMCEQLKSIRQDLTVQHIKNDFTTEVYEYHARIALENGDIGEFNQCQTQLVELHKDPANKGHHQEFVAYRVLYNIGTNNRSALNELMAFILSSPEQLASDPDVSLSLRILSAVNTGNYVRFFSLCGAIKGTGEYLVNRIVPRVRQHALLLICRSYRPSVPLEMLCHQLGFPDEAAAATWAASVGGVVVPGTSEVSTKETLAALQSK
eukprot:m51a1_g6398 hypothetical protein (689) ;mRNA; r:216130-219215